MGVIGYTSLLGSREETVNIEVGLREPVLTSVVRGEAQTLLLEPISGAPVVPSVPVLRDHEFAEFDLKRAFTTVAEVAALR